ncbi:MAG: hypothetical protein RLZZ337_710 [Bacteroidota bacterium]|jgi:SAM-dependent methyltransferase
MSEWYESWFDSPYYHQLYKDRDNREAARFITNLVKYLDPKEDATFLDLACGKGRHAIHLSQLGLQTDGADYSENSIKHAKMFESETLRFYEHDMRNPLPKNYDYILNLFTSFGYFNSQEEHYSTLQNIYNALSSEGTFVFDFLNFKYVHNHLIPQETVIKDGISFNITRSIKDQRITKTISFSNQSGEYVFTEKVMAFTKKELESLFEKCGFTIFATFGNYSLEPFDLHASKRIIYILKK